MNIILFFVLFLSHSSLQREHPVVEMCLFAMELSKKLDHINKHSFNSFELKIGKHFQVNLCTFSALK